MYVVSQAIVYATPPMGKRDLMTLHAASGVHRMQQLVPRIIANHLKGQLCIHMPLAQPYKNIMYHHLVCINVTGHTFHKGKCAVYQPFRIFYCSIQPFTIIIIHDVNGKHPLSSKHPGQILTAMRGKYPGKICMLRSAQLHAQSTVSSLNLFTINS